MRTSNPALSSKAFTFDFASERSMTLQGTVMKTGILLALAFAGACISWQLVNYAPQMAIGAAVAGLIVGLIASLVIIFKNTTAPYLAPVHALAEGLFLGAITAVVEARYPGIAPQAVGLTFGIAASLLAAYATRLIRATENLKLGIVAATGGICLVYLVSFVLRFFGTDVPFIHESGWIGIGFSLFVVVIAALNLVLDFDFIENGVEAGAPKYMEWYGAFGLILTLVWLYLEVLRLLVKLNGRD